MTSPTNDARHDRQANEDQRSADTEFLPLGATSRPDKPRAVRRCRILLVDNSPALIRAVESMLASIDWIQVVGYASSGWQALEQICDLEPNMVLLDLAMPGMDGLEVTRSLKGRPWRPRIIMMTAHVDDDYRRAAADAGVDGFILKADLWECLVALITALQGGGGGEG